MSGLIFEIQDSVNVKWVILCFSRRLKSEKSLENKSTLRGQNTSINTSRVNYWNVSGILNKNYLNIIGSCTYRTSRKMFPRKQSKMLRSSLATRSEIPLLRKGWLSLRCILFYMILLDYQFSKIYILLDLRDSNSWLSILILHRWIRTGHI